MEQIADDGSPTMFLDV